MIKTGEKNLSLTNKVEAKRFGLIVGSVFMLLALPSFFKGKSLNLYLIIIASILFLFALILPVSLVPIYKAWMRFGIILGRINSFLLLSVIFYCVLTPIAIIRRIFSEDSKKFAYKIDRSSYWMKRVSSNTAKDMKRMF